MLAQCETEETNPDKPSRRLRGPAPLTAMPSSTDNGQEDEEHSDGRLTIAYCKSCLILPTEMPRCVNKAHSFMCESSC